MLDQIVEKVTGWITDIGEVVFNVIVEALGVFIGQVLYYIESAMCYIVKLVYSFFEVFAGLKEVVYYQSDLNNQKKVIEAPLINVFFQHSTITDVYWGMALIGIAMAFGFAIWAIIKKMGDLADKEQRSIGQILGSLLKSILIILGMNLIVTATLTTTNVLMQSITDLFNNPSSATQGTEVIFDSDDYVTMNRILQTIGAYSMNPSYNSRYNINSCYNAIRSDLQYLVNKGTFRYYYETKKTVTINGVKQEKTIDTWQSVLQQVVRSHNLNEEAPIDYYDEGLSVALQNAMQVLRTNSSFEPLRYYQNTYLAAGTSNVSLDVVIFLSGTGEAARNDIYNQNVSMTDPVRGPYFTGTKSIYSYKQLKEDFDMSLTGINHLVIIIMCIMIGKELVRVILACIVRIFQMLILYIAAPPLIAIMPLDGGKKFQEWCTAFIIQAFGIFGTIITMRLLILYIPICMSSDLVLFSNPVFDLLAKVLLIYGGSVAADRSASMITGILANNAGMQAIGAGDVRGAADQMMEKTGVGKMFSAPLSAAAWGLGKAATVAKGAAGVAANVTGLSTVGNAIAGAAKSVAGAVTGVGKSFAAGNAARGGILGNAVVSAFRAFRGNGGGGGGGGSPMPPGNQNMGHADLGSGNGQPGTTPASQNQTGSGPEGNSNLTNSGNGEPGGSNVPGNNFGMVSQGGNDTQQQKGPEGNKNMTNSTSNSPSSSVIRGTGGNSQKSNSNQGMGQSNVKPKSDPPPLKK